jgi:Putative transposase
VDTDAARQTRLKERTHASRLGSVREDAAAGPEVVQDYLSRYTHRAAVSNERIDGIDAKGVRLRVRADHGGKRTTMIDAEAFIARFLHL